MFAPYSIELTQALFFACGSMALSTFVHRFVAPQGDKTMEREYEMHRVRTSYRNLRILINSDLYDVSTFRCG